MDDKVHETWKWNGGTVGERAQLGRKGGGGRGVDGKCGIIYSKCEGNAIMELLLVKPYNQVMM